MLLLTRASRKAEQNREFLLSAWEDLQTLIRLVRAWLKGEHRIPAATVLMAVAAVVYFVSPCDFIPDSIPVLGFVDDVSVIGFVAAANAREISQFRNWEDESEAASATLKSPS